MRYLALLVALLTGCLAAPPPFTPFPPPTDEYPTAVREAAVSSVQLYVSDYVRCSAVVVSAHVAYIARHCVTHPDQHPESAYLLDLAGELRPAPVWDVASELDIAWLSLGGAPATPVELAVRAPLEGERGWLVGYGCSQQRRLEARPARYVQRWRTDDPTELVMDEWLGVACHGDSGGAVLNEHGRLVGILSRIGSGEHNRGMAYAVPVQ